jgi:hypothetical protein
MLNFEKHNRTRNPVLRLVGNVSGSVSNYFLMREIRSEDKDNNSRAKLYAKLFRIFEGPQNKWGTYYTAELKSIKGDNEWTRAQTYKKFNN